MFVDGEKSTIMFESMGVETTVNSPDKVEKRDRLFKRINEDENKKSVKADLDNLVNVGMNSARD